MTPEYDSISDKINEICHADCWRNPVLDCPYYDICTDIELSGEAFELALVSRYNEIHKDK